MNTTARRSGRVRSGRKLATLHEILTAWQAGRITSRTAMHLGGIDHLSGLYEAARHSAVPIRKTLLPREAEAAEMATAAILDRRDRVALDDGQ